MIASILPMIFINSIVDNIDTNDDVTYSNTYMLGSIWYDVDIDYVTSMIQSTNSIDDIDSTIDDVTYSNTCMLDSMWYDIDIDYITLMIPSTNSIDDIDSTWM